MVRTADNKLFHRKLLSTPIEFQRSPKKYFSPNKHNLRGPGRKHVSASERTRLMEEGIFSKSRPKVRKIASDDEDGDFKFYDRSEAKQPAHVEIEKEVAESNKPTLALLPNRSEEDEINNNGEARDRVGKINLRSSNRICKPPERLDSVPYF